MPLRFIANKLTNPTIQGTVSAGTGLTMPAFTLSGDISLGANKLKFTNRLFKDSANRLLVRNVSDTADEALGASQLQVTSDGLLIDVNGGRIVTQNSDNAFCYLKARDTGVGPVEIARMVGAAWAHLLLTRARFGTTALAADADHRGGLYVAEGRAGVADKLYWIAKTAADTYSAIQVATG